MAVRRWNIGSPAQLGAAADPSAPSARPRFETLVVRPPIGHLRRPLQTVRHFTGLLAGGFVAHVRAQREEGTGRGFRFLMARLAAALLRELVHADLVAQPFPVQLRERLQLLGPTYTLAMAGPWPVWVAFFVIGLFLGVRRGA
jgi:hypothetical protein